MNPRPSAVRAEGPRSARWVLPALLVALFALRWATLPASEPFFNNDETRHVMTGVFFRDLLHALPVAHPRAWAESYYAQYPALGLLIWPPLFHFLEGLLMSCLGTGMAVARLLTAAFSALAAASVHGILRRSHGPGTAAVGTLLFALFPSVFALSGQVMLEIPALALGLFGTLHCLRYVDHGRDRDLWLAAAGATAAALTRYDALVFPVAWLAWILAAGRGRVLLRPRVWAAALASLALLAPAYWIAAREVGWLQAGTVVHSNVPAARGLRSLARLGFYLSRLPAQLGWPALVPAVAGLAACLAPARRARALPMLALFATTWAVFTGIGELEPRHALYWTPALAVLAAEGLALVPRLAGRALAAAVILATAAGTLAAPRPFLRGYAEAARVVTADPGGARACLFDGELEGDFVYQVRRRDPVRHMWVLRGDRLLYSTLAPPSVQYREIARTDSEVVQLLAASHAGWIVVEERPRRPLPPAARRLRRVLRERPDCFRLDRVIPVVTHRHDPDATRLLLYRSRCASPGGAVPAAPWVPQLRRRVAGGTP